MTVDVTGVNIAHTIGSPGAKSDFRAAEALDFQLFEALFNNGIDSCFGAASGRGVFVETPRPRRSAPHLEVKKKTFAFIFPFKGVIRIFPVFDAVKPAASPQKTADRSRQFPISGDSRKEDGGILTGTLGNSQLPDPGISCFAVKHRKKAQKQKTKILFHQKTLLGNC